MWWNILVWAGDVFDAPLLIVMLLCGLWSFWMVRPAMAEKDLQRESRVAAAGGFFYLTVAVVMFVALRVARIFLPL